MFKSVWAVGAGFITVVLLSVGTDLMLEAAGVFPPISQQELFVTWMLVLALFYRSVYSVAGGFVTSMLAPSKPRRHVLALAAVGFAAGIAGVFAGWNLSAHWYPIALAVTGPFFVMIGGRLRTRSRAETDF